MTELANYSIETDNLVLLAFKDGSRLRVPLAKLSDYLGSKDLQKVRRAAQLRRDFFRQHMPRTLLFAASAAGLAALFVVGEQKVASYVQHHTHAAAPSPASHAKIMRTTVSGSAANPSVPQPASAAPAVNSASADTSAQPASAPLSRAAGHASAASAPASSFSLPAPVTALTAPVTGTLHGVETALPVTQPVVDTVTKVLDPVLTVPALRGVPQLPLLH